MWYSLIPDPSKNADPDPMACDPRAVILDLPILIPGPTP